MLKLATILDNPGEPHAQTRYRDPHELKALGYNGLVIYETTGLSGIDHLDRLGTGEIRRWVEQQIDHLRQRITQAAAADLEVYVCYDALSLARGAVEQHQAQLVCKNRRDYLCPASDVTLERSTAALRGLLAMLPPVAGVVLRFGDNDASRLPYLMGNDIYLPHCARCSQLGRADRVVQVIQRFYRLVVEELDKRLIVRAWNVRPNGMHDSVELCRRIASRLPGGDDDRLALSFKFTHTDFWRFQSWNPASLVFGDRPILYELQCQREFEGKGGIPNWQVPLWRDGPPPPEAHEGDVGLARVVGQINFAGLWAWVRGGGWGGPFIKNETWIDANVFAVPLLAEHPQTDPRKLARQWIHERLQVKDDAVAAVLQQILERSPKFILQAFYIGSYSRGRDVPWHPNADWIQDDLLDAEAAWRIVQRLPDAALDEVIAEKTDAVAQVSADRAALQQLVTEENHAALDPLVNTLLYAESFMAALRDLLAGLIAYRRFQKSSSPELAEQCRQRLLACQSHWNHHTQRYSSLPGAATAFRETHLWDLTQRVLGTVAGK